MLTIGIPTAVRAFGGDDMSDSVGQYLNEIGAVALLTAQDERELAQTI